MCVLRAWPEGWWGDEGPVEGMEERVAYRPTGVGVQGKCSDGDLF